MCDISISYFSVFYNIMKNVFVEEKILPNNEENCNIIIQTKN